MFAVFNLSVFTSAFLLFLIQPMVANILLPKVGGAPNIWNTCSVFFQLSLLAGYFYSYLVSQKLSLKRQIIIHCTLLFCALWAVNFHFQSDRISIESPVSDTLFSLLKNVFFPFVLLSTTSPLIQRWLSLSDLKESKNPYVLYVCSNVGSLLALYTYPLVLERKLAISAQGDLWHILFAAFFATVAVLGTYLIKTVKNRTQETASSAPTEKTNPVLIFYWIFFAFVPSSLMLGVTSHLSTDIGGLPFLWILPLSLYLLSFIWTFSKLYTPEISALFQRLYKATALVTVFLFFTASATSNLKQNLLMTGVHCLFYFILAVYCHGVLSAKKPSAEKLTLFYLCLSIGGALGGIFNTFVAPHLFLSVWEYPFVIALSLPFAVSGLREGKRDFLKTAGRVVLLFVIVAVSLRLKLIKNDYVITGFMIVLALSTLCFIFFKKRNFLCLCLFGFCFLQIFLRSDFDVVFQKRNFFGTVIVRKNFIPLISMASLALAHGDTLHGRQNLFELKNGEIIYDFNPDTFYGKHAAVKDFFDVFKRPYAPNVVWLGLGSGAIICYAPPETKHDVFEIDRDIADVSLKYRYFRYLEHCAPQANVRIGDARMEISKENDRKYDLIVFDAFSSHFIPVHLTTKEAIETYRSKLKPDGVILFHISSRAFDVEPFLTRIAEELKMTFIVRYSPEKDFKYPQWGVLSNSGDAPEIKALLAMPGWRKGEMKKNTMLWTDDFHNLLSALRR